jgi:hypothetical protein
LAIICGQKFEKKLNLDLQKVVFMEFYWQWIQEFCHSLSGKYLFLVLFSIIAEWKIIFGRNGDSYNRLQTRIGYIPRDIIHKQKFIAVGLSTYLFGREITANSCSCPLTPKRLLKSRTSKSKSIQSCAHRFSLHTVPMGRQANLSTTHMYICVHMYFDSFISTMGQSRWFFTSLRNKSNGYVPTYICMYHFYQSWRHSENRPAFDTGVVT